jgi:hypothetical protein
MSDSVSHPSFMKNILLWWIKSLNFPRDVSYVTSSVIMCTDITHIYSYIDGSDLTSQSATMKLRSPLYEIVHAHICITLCHRYIHVAEERINPTQSSKRKIKIIQKPFQLLENTGWNYSTTICDLFSGIFINIIYVCWPKTGAHGSVVGCGTMLQAGRSPFRVPNEVNFFSIYIILPEALWPWGRLSF